jgi:hypothetical protein
MTQETVLTKRLPTALTTAGVIGAVLLLAAEFMPLLHTYVDSTQQAVATTTVGSADGYAFVPVAILAGLFAVGVRTARGRLALLGVGVLGVVALVIALTHDLPAVSQQGLRMETGKLVTVADSAAFGFYVETFAAVVLVATCVCGFILLGSPQSARRSAHSRRAAGSTAGS